MVAERVVVRKGVDDPDDFWWQLPAVAKLRTPCGGGGSCAAKPAANCG
jgi:hypothetical protein